MFNLHGTRPRREARRQAGDPSRGHAAPACSTPASFRLSGRCLPLGALQVGPVPVCSTPRGCVETLVFSCVLVFAANQCHFLCEPSASLLSKDELTSWMCVTFVATLHTHKSHESISSHEAWPGGAVWPRAGSLGAVGGSAWDPAKLLRPPTHRPHPPFHDPLGGCLSLI